MEEKSSTLKYKHLGIYTQNEHVVYMREDCHVCVSEGFEALTRIRVSNFNTSIVASLNVITSGCAASRRDRLIGSGGEKIKSVRK